MDFLLVRRVSLIFCAVMAGLAGLLSAHAGEKLFVVTEDYPPYEMADAVNGLRGFDYDLAREAFARMGYEADIQFFPWKRALLYARRGDAVGILTCAHLPAREEFLLFSNPISSFTSGFYTRSGFDGPVPESFADLQGQRVGSVNGYESKAALEQAGLSPLGAVDTPASVRMLWAGRFDYLFLARQSTDFVIKQMDWANRFDFHPMSTRDFHFCFSKNYPGVEAIAAHFNKTLERMRNEGRVEEIHSRYR